MWIFLNDAFVSAVQHRHYPEALMVRARLEGDLEKLFPNRDVTETPSADYRFRAVVPKTEFAKVIAARIAAIDYTNFKNTVFDETRHHAYMGVWTVMHTAQITESGDSDWWADYDDAVDADLAKDDPTP